MFFLALSGASIDRDSLPPSTKVLGFCQGWERWLSCLACGPPGGACGGTRRGGMGLSGRSSWGSGGNKLSTRLPSLWEQNVNDAMTVLPKLSTGLDVNVRFTGVSDFEYTPECIVFDLLNIPLYHGWLVDPQVSCSFKSLRTSRRGAWAGAESCGSGSLRVQESLIPSVRV